MYLTFNISGSKRKDSYHIDMLFVFKKDSFCFISLMTLWVDGWCQSTFVVHAISFIDLFVPFQKPPEQCLVT